MARRRWRPSREAAEVEDVAGGDGAAEVEASAGGDDARWRAAAQVGEEQGAVAAADVDVDDVRGRGDGADLRAGEEQDGGRAAEGGGGPQRRPERSRARWRRPASMSMTCVDAVMAQSFAPERSRTEGARRRTRRWAAEVWLRRGEQAREERGGLGEFGDRIVDPHT